MENAAVEAHILSMFGSVPGVHAHGMIMTPPMSGRHMFTLDMSCWSPTFHRVSARTSHILPLGIERKPAAMGREMARLLLPALMTQRRRAADGVAMGTAVPLDASQGISVMGHVRMDRGLIGLLETGRYNMTLAAITPSIVDLHRTTGYDGGDLVQDDDAIEDNTFRTMIRLSDGLLYDGQDLSIHDFHTPETIRKGVVGRQLGDVVEVPEAIAGHVIESWTDDEFEADWTNIRIAPDLVRLDADPRTWGG